ncbi:hypothetical protein EV175_004518 [Coemansia sp. RSA 1933]|nr:hypothetical protein EV175_004518 [Coemansia sp. RSA 1933]
MTQTVAIIGATGLQGGSVLRALHETGKYNLIAVTRNTSSDSALEIKSKYPGVKLVQANLNDVESLKEAFSGADVVFGTTLFAQPDVLERVAAGDLDAEFNQGKNATDAAIAVGVKDIIFSTIYSVSELSNGKYTKVYPFEGKDKIEKYIRSKSSEIRSVFVHLGTYMENFVRFSRISSEDNKTVEFTIPAKPTTRIALVDTKRDTGGVVAYILDNFDEFVGRSIEVSSGYYEIQELATAFTEATGVPSRYVQVPYDYFNNEVLAQMFKSFEEFGYYGWRTDFLELNKKMSYKHTTPIEYWRNRGWTGPSQ